jgi:Thioredoxin-like
MYGHERSLVKRLENKPFALIGVNSDNDREELKQVLQEQRITWRSFWDGRKLAQPWQLEGWPTLCIIDAKGVIRHRWAGSPGDAVLDKAIDDLLKEVK